MSSGITLQELNRLFEFLKQSKTNDEMTVLITNDMCKSLYNLMENCVEYQDKLQSNWNSLREDLKRYDLTYLHETGEHQLADAIEDILDKMNELERKDKE